MCFQPQKSMRLKRVSFCALTHAKLYARAGARRFADGRRDGVWTQTRAHHDGRAHDGASVGGSRLGEQSKHGSEMRCDPMPMQLRDLQLRRPGKRTCVTNQKMSASRAVYYCSAVLVSRRCANLNMLCPIQPPSDTKPDGLARKSSRSKMHMQRRHKARHTAQYRQKAHFAGRHHWESTRRPSRAGISGADQTRRLLRAGRRACPATSWCSSPACP